MMSRTLISTALFSLLLLILGSSVFAYPSLSQSSSESFLRVRQDAGTAEPYFPATPASCPICEQNYPSISSCAAACPVLANFSLVLFNPGAFYDVIKCACTDTFQSVFPQCADCFEQTNQTDVLNAPNLPAVVSGVRQVCSFASSILGNASNVDNETTPSAGAAASATASASAGTRTSDISLGSLQSLVLAFGVAVVSAALL
ncbi:hypothetical protein BV25DRAFT_1831970 [Artomyces pyxidatus]|uniref:Uncharacterized protein n=1 Tax=Artomyces pyxidatus TaxID=48021 RepID=A0ACB8SJA5_9AGAM|nr:hypothetical protein BV25DRAFT_1831970 [Artomyces pyxidatus]